MKRPAAVPADARWNADDSEWELGEERGGRPVGPWTWWRADGSVVCRSTYDDSGRLVGVSRRFHPNGELSCEVTYEAGEPHGRVVACRPSEGMTDESDAAQLAQMDPELFRMDSAYEHGEPVATTLYNRKGLLEPIERDSDLASQLDKLLPGTSLVLTTPFLSTLGSAPRQTVDAMLDGEGDDTDRLILPPKIPRSMVTELHYICAAVVGGTTHRIAVTDHQGGAHLAIVESPSVSKSLALAVDARLSEQEEP